jgi:hypothetical protein
LWYCARGIGELVEIAIVELGEHRLQQIKSAADITNDPIGIKRVPPQFSLNHEGRAVQLLSRPENSAHQTVRNHEVMADGDAVHGSPHGSIIPERVAVDACGAAARCGSKLDKVGNGFAARNEGS